MPFYFEYQLGQPQVAGVALGEFVKDRSYEANIKARCDPGREARRQRLPLKSVDKFVQQLCVFTFTTQPYQPLYYCAGLHN